MGRYYPGSWREACEEYARLTNMSLMDVVREQTELFLRDVTLFTPPTRGKGVTRQSGSQQRQSGFKTIDYDIDKTYTAAADLSINRGRVGKYVQRYIDSADLTKLQSLMDRFYKGKKWEIMLAVHPAQHDAIRNPNTGRPKRGVPRRIIIDRPSIETLRELKKSHVGEGKSGWLVPIRQLGFKLRPGFTWITKATKQAPGFARVDRTETSPSITVANAVPYGQKAEWEMMVQRALDLRPKVMLRRLAYLMRKPKVRQKAA